MDSKIIESFKKEFLLIKSKGFVPSKRIHDTGIGKTFEDLMNIVENNVKVADYKGFLELKSKRALSESMVTCARANKRVQNCFCIFAIRFY